MGLPNGFPEEMVWLTKLDSYHDPPVHGFIKVVGSVGCHDDETIMPEAQEYT